MSKIYTTFQRPDFIHHADQLRMVSPAYAFDGRSETTKSWSRQAIPSTMIYTSVQTSFVLDGTVNGDVVAFSKTVTIDGTVNGDLMTAAQTVVVNGTITGDIRMAGIGAFHRREGVGSTETSWVRVTALEVRQGKHGWPGSLVYAAVKSFRGGRDPQCHWPPRRFGNNRQYRRRCQSRGW